jgi:hypothetical protein
MRALSAAPYQLRNAHRDIPTVMFGPSSSGSAAEDVLNEDRVLEAMVLEAATVYGALMRAVVSASPES